VSAEPIARLSIQAVNVIRDRERSGETPTDLPYLLEELPLNE
jgi:hypothetical protein